ncbi:hypothetical protein RHGRI_012672 [Rhododendron griersonianum]|uniref:Uncharacterized protein n=1 Tax=Rhododendron griersonianum TaxID=479676 RepID=A0AAV6KRD0_9ERIC|nr:hypothetical protein RHGRI_012672 [Rhododendron griersonianum]
MYLNCITYSSTNDIYSCSASFFVVLCSELRNQVSAVQTSIVSNDCWNCNECPGESFNGMRFFPRSLTGQLIHCLCHNHLRPSATKQNPTVIYSLRQNTQGIMQRPFSFIEHVIAAEKESHKNIST